MQRAESKGSPQGPSYLSEWHRLESENAASQAASGLPPLQRARFKAVAEMHRKSVELVRFYADDLKEMRHA